MGRVIAEERGFVEWGGEIRVTGVLAGAAAAAIRAEMTRGATSEWRSAKTAADTLVPSIGFTLVAKLVFFWFRRFRDAGNPVPASEREERSLADATVYLRVMFLVTSVVKMASHLGWAPPDVQETLFPALGIPLLASIAHYFRALWLVKRAKAAASS